MRKKIKEAKNLLTYSTLTSCEIAHNLGFSSQSHFTYTFKKYTSVTPKQYRNMNFENTTKIE